MKDKSKLVEASWELFMQTGDPFYIMAKNTFMEDTKKVISDVNEKFTKGTTDGKKDNKHNHNKGNMS